jgi:hypothetical protein
MPKSRAIKGIDEDMKLSKALWEMAEVLSTPRSIIKFIQRGSGSHPSRENF